MKTFPAAFTTELTKRTGITPIWILRLVVNSITYDLSDVAYTFPAGMANGFTTTLPWIGQWGEVRESISGAIGEMLVSDFSCTALVDQDVTDNIRHLALNHPLEQSPVELYLWLDGLTNATAPQRLFRGYVKDIEVPDETQVHLTIEDESTRFQKYIGTRISSEAYPFCDPDDVGKMIPIVYGSVTKLPCRCVEAGWVSSIVADILATDTTVTVSEVPAKYSLQLKTVTIDDEQILVQSAAGKVLTILRAQGGTLAAGHTKGSVIIEKKSTPLVYLAADHAVDTIGTIMARVRGIDVDITSDCTKYLNIASGQLGGLYTGKAGFTIPDFAKVAQRIQLALNDTIKLNDAGHSHTTGATVATGTQNASPLPTSFPVVNIGSTYLIYPHSFYIIYCGQITFPPAGSMFECSLTFTMSSTSYDWFLMGGANNYPVGTNQAEIFGLTTKPTVSTYTLNLDATQMKYDTISVYRSIQNPSNYNMSIGPNVSPTQVLACSRTYKSTVNGTATTQTGALVTKSGTVTLAGNSVADITVGDMLLANVTRNITTPAAVIGNLLSTYCNDSTLTQIGTLPTVYSFNGAITEYKKAIEWLDYLSFQARSFFRKIGGVSRLVVRDINPAVTGTIPACILTGEGIKGLSYKKAPITDVINKVKVLYGRDWAAKGKQAESYMSAVAPTTDAVSISIYDEQEQPDMFMFDFVTNSSMANDLATFYLDFYADRKWRISFGTYLDFAQFEFGDVVSLPFANDLVGILVEAGAAPGSVDKIDVMNFVVEAAILPVLPDNAVTTLTGDWLKYKDGDGVTYV